MPDLTPERLAELERLEESATGMVKRSQFIGALISAAPALIEAAKENARLKRIEAEAHHVLVEWKRSAEEPEEWDAIRSLEAALEAKHAK